MKFQSYWCTALPFICTFFAHAQDQVEDLSSQHPGRELQLTPDDIFDMEAYVENIESSGVTQECMAEFRQIRFFEYEHFLHDPLNLAVDSGVVFEYNEEADIPYPVTIGQRSENPVNEKWAEEQCKESGGEFKVMNGEYHADGGNTVGLLLLGLQGIAVRPGLLGNYQAIIALAIGYAFLHECENDNMMPLFLVQLFLDYLASDDLASDNECRPTFIYRNRYACVPKDDSCEDDEIQKMLLISDSTYYIIHSLDTKITNLLSGAIIDTFWMSDDVPSGIYIEDNLLKVDQIQEENELFKSQELQANYKIKQAQLPGKAIARLHEVQIEKRLSKALVGSAGKFKRVRTRGSCKEMKTEKKMLKPLRRKASARRSAYFLENGMFLVNIVGEIEEDILGVCADETILELDKDVQKAKKEKKAKRTREVRGLRR